MDLNNTSLTRTLNSYHPGGGGGGGRAGAQTKTEIPGFELRSVKANGKHGKRERERERERKFGKGRQTHI